MSLFYQSKLDHLDKRASLHATEVDTCGDWHGAIIRAIPYCLIPV